MVGLGSPCWSWIQLIGVGLIHLADLLGSLQIFNTRFVHVFQFVTSFRMLDTSLELSATLLWLILCAPHNLINHLLHIKKKALSHRHFGHGWEKTTIMLQAGNSIRELRESRNKHNPLFYYHLPIKTMSQPCSAVLKLVILCHSTQTYTTTTLKANRTNSDI